MSVIQFADNLSSVVRYALDTTRATTTCPFHPNVTIRVGDDAAELGTGQKNRQERWYSMGRDGSQRRVRAATESSRRPLLSSVFKSGR